MDEYINKIINIEEYARTITKEAYQKKGNMDKEINEAIAQYRLLLEKKEEEEQNQITSNAKCHSEQELKIAKYKLKSILELIDSKFRINKSIWEDKVFQTIIQH